jgi:hypothetical protein
MMQSYHSLNCNCRQYRKKIMQTGIRYRQKYDTDRNTVQTEIRHRQEYDTDRKAIQKYDNR